MDVFPDEPRHDGARGESSGYGSDEGTEPDAVDEARAGTGSETDADAREDAESPDERLARYWSRVSEEFREPWTRPFPSSRSSSRR